MPRRSGTHMADSCTPRSFSGGNVIGTRMMQLKMPYSLRMLQNGLLLRSSRTSALPSGNRYLPKSQRSGAAAESPPSSASADRSAGPE